MVLAFPLGMVSVAQAGSPGQCEHAVVECQRIPGGGIKVIIFDNDKGHAPEIVAGEDCSKALGRIENDPDNFRLRSATSGSSDKTVYTWRGCVN